MSLYCNVVNVIYFNISQVQKIIIFEYFHIKNKYLIYIYSPIIFINSDVNENVIFIFATAGERERENHLSLHPPPPARIGAPSSAEQGATSGRNVLCISLI